VSLEILSGEAVADGERDALAIIAACARDDFEVLPALLRGADGLALVVGLLNQVYDILAEHGVDPAEWAARKQAEHRARLAAPDTQ
jgi:hypothetical protein